MAWRGLAWAGFLGWAEHAVEFDFDVLLLVINPERRVIGHKLLNLILHFLLNSLTNASDFQ